MKEEQQRAIGRGGVAALAEKVRVHGVAMKASKAQDWSGRMKSIYKLNLLKAGGGGLITRQIWNLLLSNLPHLILAFLDNNDVPHHS